jgi:hypothetical protein
MKNSLKKGEKTNTSLPLEGGGRRVGVKECEVITRRLKSILTLQVTPHPNPLPQGERGIKF